jgi:hypothetical protein
MKLEIVSYQDDGVVMKLEIVRDWWCRDKVVDLTWWTVN